MRRFLFWLTGYLPCRIIAEEGSVYLERYYLCTLLGWRFYLHRFVGSDPDRGLHDHPWRMAFSIILAGWYWEETAYGMRRVAWFNWLTGESKHRVVLPMHQNVSTAEHINEIVPRALALRTIDASDVPPVVPCWTLFFHRAENVKPWGFYETLPDGSMIFRPYTYAREGNQTDWWLTAPNGRNEPRRAKK